MKNESIQHWDIIGDIHGELNALRWMLTQLGYYLQDGRIVHPKQRKVIFVGDFIDRGSDSRGVLHLVKQMMDADMAVAVMGNHEFNFVSYMTPDGEGGYLRPHHGNYPSQVAVTLESFAGHEDEIDGWVEWMKGLPFFLDLGPLRVVHASWIPEDIDYLRDRSLEDAEFLREANVKSSRAYQAIERVLKGVEIDLPAGFDFADSNGVSRKNMRVRWWEALEGKTWSEVAFPSRSGLPDVEAEVSSIPGLPEYGCEEAPVFFGHYKLVGHPLALPMPNVACIDFGLGHGGPATAYRWSGESPLDPANFLTVPMEKVPLFEVLVDDNFHFMDPEENYRSSDSHFECYEDAVARAKLIVDGELENCYKPGMTPDYVAGIYRTYGDDPFIRPAPIDKPLFSAWRYASERAPSIVREMENGSADSA